MIQSTMSKNALSRPFMLAYRLWIRPSEDLPFKDLDDLPDHRLWDVLEAHGRKYLVKKFGSVEGWYKQRALNRIARNQKKVALDVQRRLHGSVPNSERVPTLEEAIAEEQNDKRHFVEQLVFETDALALNTPDGAPCNFLIGCCHNLDEWAQCCALRFVMPFDSEFVARRVAQYLTSRREEVLHGQSTDAWARFAVIPVDELDVDGRVRVAEDLRLPETARLVKRVHKAIDILHDAGVIDERSFLEYLASEGTGGAPPATSSPKEAAPAPIASAEAVIDDGAREDDTGTKGDSERPDDSAGRGKAIAKLAKSLKRPEIEILRVLAGPDVEWMNVKAIVEQTRYERRAIEEAGARLRDVHPALIDTHKRNGYRITTDGRKVACALDL
jgi:hypothetical protein